MSVQFKLAFIIEQDDEVPIPLVQVGIQELEGDQAKLLVVATNWAASDTGAQAVASLLRETADAIDRELGVSRAEPEDRTAGQVEHKTVRPRFNPQPRKIGKS